MPASGWSQADERAIVRAVYDFVVTQTRYVGLEFGIHGYKPYRVDRRARAGASATARTRRASSTRCSRRSASTRGSCSSACSRLGRIPEAPASLAVFNHAILYVPDLDLWLDGTASYSGSGELPGEDRGASVLVVEPSGAPRFSTIPEAAPDQNRTDTTFDVAIAPDGTARVAGASRIAGAEAPQYRRAYLSEHDRRAQLEKAFNRTFPGLRVREVTVSDLSRIEDEVKMSFALDVPRYAQPDGAGLRFTPFGGGAGYVEAYASLSERRHDLVVGDPMQKRFTYRFALPAGWKVAEVPEDAAADGPDASFEVRYHAEDGTLVVEGHVTFKTGRVPAERYPGFRELVAGIDRAFSRRVRIGPASEGSRP